MGVAIPQVVTEDRASGAQVVDGSLKFDRTKTQYLTRDPNGTAGNSNTFTISFWYKRTKPGSTDYHFFSAGDTSTNRMLCEHGGTDNLSFTRVNSSVDANRTTSRVFRDYSGWQHIVFAVDTTLSTASDRIKVYVNGVRETDFSSSSDPTQSTSFYWNADVVHSIGTRSYSLTSNPFDGHFAQWYNIDGQALGPGYFGYTDPLTETWRPKKFKAEGTTVNDGRTWSSTTNGNFNTGASRGADKAFDGNVGGTVYAQANTGTTATVSNLGITGIRSIRVNIAKNNTGDNWGTFALDSTDLTSWLQTNYPSQGNTGTWIDVTSQFTSSTLDSISITTQSNNTDDIRLAGVEINGTILLDGVTQNLSYGTNGFYLPMDGNSPIGEDKSGNGNNWTPINFGGSNTLEKATGALPILNTDGGGKTARPGVFGSEVGAYYAVTVPSGIGGGYYLDGTQKPALSLIRGATYTFDQSDSSNSSHPLVFGTTTDGNDYSDGVTTNGTPGSAGAYTKITVPHNAPDTLYYHCSAHGGMGSSTSQTTDIKKADPYAWKNVLALPLVGSKDDVSNRINSGSTTKTVTANDNAAASSAQSNFYGGSYYFDGNGDYLSLTSSSDFAFGTGDFTVEAWIYPTNVTSYRSIWEGSTGAGTNPPFRLQIAGGQIEYAFADNRETVGSIVANKWQHIAVSRQGTTGRLFINGNFVSSLSTSDNLTSTHLHIGKTHDNFYYTGYIQDHRAYKGVAKYTSNFIPASTDPDILPDTPSGVSGGSKLTKITDGAVYFDGSGDYLAVTSNDFRFGTNDFTIEAFIHPTTLDTSGMSNSVAPFIDYDGYSSSGAWFSFQQVNSGLQFGSNGAARITTTSGLYIGWCHVAVVRSSGTTTLYLNGKSQGSFSDSFNYTDSNDRTLFIGYQNYLTRLFTGYVSNVRIVNGTALYTSDFTPPSAPLTDVTNTTLLCCQSNALAGSAAVSPNISGINDGTVWSANFTSTSGFAAANPASKAFDGLDTTYAEPVNTSSTMTVTFNPPLVVSGDFEVLIGSAGELFTTINGGASTSQGSGLTQYHTLGSNITVSNFTYTSSTRPVLYRVRVNGSTILTDPVTKNGNAAATIFNPFTTDINAVRGQETGYATMNPLANYGVTLSNGNLTCTGGNDIPSTIGVKSGKWYAEVDIRYPNAPSDLMHIGICATGTRTFGMGAADGHILANLDYILIRSDAAGPFSASGRGGLASVSNVYDSNADYTDGDVISIELDLDNTYVKFYKNGILRTHYTFTLASTFDRMYFYNRNNGSGVTSWNFGQKPFKFPQPEGFQPLNAANVRPSTVNARPDQYVGITTWSGDGSPTRSITGYNFKPDLVWLKSRLVNNDHNLFDSVRGVQNTLISNSTGDEVNQPIHGWVSSFDNNGFSVTGGSLGDVNYTGGRTYVAWGWKAGGNSNTFNIDDVGYASAAAAGLDGGSITPTAASVNTKSGFSIITYTGTGNNTNTATSTTSVGHGLNIKPSFAIFKNRTSTTDWVVYHKSLANNQIIEFTTGAAQGPNYCWNATDPTSSVFYLGNNGQVNNTGNNYVFYCWADVPGLQKFGSYTGNGDADGPFVELGFRPAVVLRKCSSTGGSGYDWVIIDTERNSHNISNNKLYPQYNGAENVNSDNSDSGNNSSIDILSNGFKVRASNGRMNQSGQTFIYAAWAEAPTFNLYGAQSNAR